MGGVYFNETNKIRISYIIFCPMILVLRPASIQHVTYLHAIEIYQGGVQKQNMPFQRTPNPMYIILV